MNEESARYQAGDGDYKTQRKGKGVRIEGNMEEIRAKIQHGTRQGMGIIGGGKERTSGRKLETAGSHGDEGEGRR